MKIVELKTNHLDRPLGFEFETITLSWQVEESAGICQKAARIQVALEPRESAVVFDSGAKELDSIGWVLPMETAPRTRYYWRVTVWSDAGEEATSDWTWFETPKGKQEPWQGEWVTSPFGRKVHPVFTRCFEAEAQPIRARCYLLGLGMYEAKLNGMKVGDEVLAPGFHSYDSYLMYQTLEMDVHSGENILEIMLGEGWYMGRYGLKASAPRYGEEYALLAQVHLWYADGREQVIGTDESWTVTAAPVTMDSIYHGETWNTLQDPGKAVNAVRMAKPPRMPVARINPLIRIHETIHPVLTKENEQVLDMGQNFAGWCSFYCNAPAGTTIRLLFAEYMKDGDVYRDNLRTAQCTFTYISDGMAREVHPHFTYFGFRYVKVEGWPGKLNPEAFTGCVIYSDLERTGYIETSDPQVNRLFENTVWSQKSNFIDIPTDCPQRDERMGWTGDIQIFADTASFHMDTTAFLNKFMRDLRSEQKLLNGSVPCVVPMCRYELNGVAAWGDAACVVPWRIYEHSGDRRLLADHYPAMKDWVEWIARENERHGSGELWDGCPQLGDWLALDGDSVYGGTERTYVATAYYYLSTLLTAKAARELGYQEEQTLYEQKAEAIRDAFRSEFFTASGRIAVATQTACVMALYLQLVPENAREKTGQLLTRLIRENGIALRTGFVGTPWLLPVLCDIGQTGLAYDLLFRQDYPGWMYELNHGATTIWERWNSIEPDGSMNRDGMNSFNHYAYGSVASWMYRYMAGLNPLTPGFRAVRIAPIPDARLQSCRAELSSPCGLYRMEWSLKGSAWSLDVLIPFGCSAQVLLPDGREEQVHAGSYHWQVTLEKKYYSLDSSLGELLSNSETREVLTRLFPMAIRGVAFQYEMHTLAQLVISPFSELKDNQVQALRKALEKIPRKISRAGKKEQPGE